MSPPGYAVSTGLADTINVTWMSCMCVSKLISTLPEYVPAGSPTGLAITVSWAGAVPPVEETESHVPVAVTVAVYVALAKPFTTTVCAAGAGSPACATNTNEAGLATFDIPLTTSVTATVCVPPSASVAVMVPGYVPGSKPAGFTVTFRLAGSGPDIFVVTPFTRSQFLVLVAWAT